MSCADLNCQAMVPGETYTFFFKYSGFLQINIPANAAAAQLGKDSQFQNVSGAQGNCQCLFKTTVISLSFKWNGSGCILVGQAGQIAQQDLANFWLTGIGTSLIFDGASTGVSAPCCDPNVGSSWTTYIIVGLLGFAALAYYMGWHQTIIARVRGAVA